MAAMEKMHTEAGVRPPPVETEKPVSEGNEVDPSRLTKKRLLSGSPTGKYWDESGLSGSGNGSGDLEPEITGDDWRQSNRRKKRRKIMLKNEARK